MKVFRGKNRSSLNAIFLFVSLFLFAFVLALAACFSPWKGDAGTFIVSVGGSPGVSRMPVSWLDDFDSDELEHTIILCNGPGADQTKTVSGAQTVQFTVIPGIWDIIVEAYYVWHQEPEPYRAMVAGGSLQRVNIVPGLNGTFNIKMGPLEEIPEPDFTVSAWGELWSYIEGLDPGEARIIEITENLVANTDIDSGIMTPTVHIDNGKQITLLASNSITIKRGSYPEYSGDFILPFFEVSNGSILILGSENSMYSSGIVIDGCFYTSTAPSSVSPIISVKYGSILVMYNGASLEGNGWYYDGSTGFRMSNGNCAVNVEGSFDMYGGTISNNYALFCGGGVFVGYGGVFTLNGGTIDNNEADDGGGVYVAGNGSDNGVFLMYDGAVIAGNKALRGGGVCVAGYGIFNMDSGIIGGNDADVCGGGVCVDYDGTFTMNSGEIRDNNTYNGGGVYVDSFAGPEGFGFTMTSGTITGNWAVSNGGGVYAGSSGKFKKTGGVIYGGNTGLSLITRPEKFDNMNLAGNTFTGTTLFGSSGHAVYVTSMTSPAPGRAEKKIDDIISGEFNTEDP